MASSSSSSNPEKVPFAERERVNNGTDSHKLVARFKLGDEAVEGANTKCRTLFRKVKTIINCLAVYQKGSVTQRWLKAGARPASGSFNFAIWYVPVCYAPVTLFSPLCSKSLFNTAMGKLPKGALSECRNSRYCPPGPII